MIAPDVAKALWERIEPQLRAHATLFLVRPGMKADRRAGKSAKEVTFDAVMELLQSAYSAGLREGYDMAREVFE